MAEKAPILYPQLPDNTSTSEEAEPIPEYLKTTPEEKIYGTIPRSSIATTVALMHSKAQTNPIVPRCTKTRLKTFKKKKTTIALVPKSGAIQATKSTMCAIL